MKEKWLSRCLPFVALVFIALLASCHDGDEPPTPIIGPDPGLVVLEKSQVSVGALGGWLGVSVRPVDSTVTAIVSSDAAWLTVESDTVPRSGMVDLSVAALPDDAAPRTAHLTIKATRSDTTRTYTIQVEQGSDGKNAEVNGQRTMMVGYGYYIYGPYSNIDGVSARPILKESYLGATEADGLVYTVERNAINMEHITANSLFEMGYLLTERMETTKSGIAGSSKTVKATQQSGYDQVNTGLVFIRMVRSVAQRNIDVGRLSQLVDENKEVFDPAFVAARQQVIDNPTKENVEKLIADYGTHLIVQAELGGTMDLSVNFQSEMKGTLDMRAEDFENYFFNDQTSNFLLSNGMLQGISQKTTLNDRVTIKGGSAASVKAIRDDMSSTHRPPTAEHLAAWYQSLNVDLNDVASTENLVPVNFKVMPLWMFFPAKTLPLFLEVIKEKAAQYNNEYATSLKMDHYYKLSLHADMLRFSDDGTLVRTLSTRSTSKAAWIPTLELCNEYVPTIRGDRRITVVYPIKDGEVMHNMGLFLGDGEGHPPAWLTFSNASVYVQPIDGMTGKDVISTVYFMKGRLYISDFGMALGEPNSVKTDDQYVKFKNSYPIVKIGADYWMRSDVSEELQWGYFYIYRGVQRFGSSYTYADTDGRNTLYAKMTDNGVAPEYDKVVGKDKWYLPTMQQASDLVAYLGHNPRQIMRGQLSGFEAQFHGSYGSFDDIRKIQLSKSQFFYEGQYNFIPCRDVETNRFDIFCISSDYKLFFSRHSPDVSLQAMKANSYPLRLCRSAAFRY